MEFKFVMTSFLDKDSFKRLAFYFADGQADIWTLRHVSKDVETLCNSQIMMEFHLKMLLQDSQKKFDFEDYDWLEKNYILFPKIFENDYEKLLKSKIPQINDASSPKGHHIGAYMTCQHCNDWCHGSMLYEGEFRVLKSGNRIQHGLGVMYDQKTFMIYMGKFENGKFISGSEIPFVVLSGQSSNDKLSNDESPEIKKQKV